MLPGLQNDEQRRVGLEVGDVVGARGVFQRLAQILGDLITGAQRSTVGELLVGRGHAAKEILRSGWS